MLYAAPETSALTSTAAAVYKLVLAFLWKAIQSQPLYASTLNIAAYYPHSTAAVGLPTRTLTAVSPASTRQILTDEARRLLELLKHATHKPRGRGFA